MWAEPVAYLTTGPAVISASFPSIPVRGLVVSAVGRWIALERTVPFPQVTEGRGQIVSRTPSLRGLAVCLAVKVFVPTDCVRFFHVVVIAPEV